MVEKFITGLCYMGGGLLALTIVGLATWFACWVWIKVSSRFRGICKAESLIYEYKNNRDDFMYWKYMIKKGGEKAILAERDAAVAELERIEEGLTMFDDLKPCPFCGSKARIEEYAMGHKGNGTFTASYKCSCDNCKIYFAHNSEFTLEHGQPKFIHNGYDIVRELWNRRTDNG